ncbi:uncharacterized protein [Musca autumnalis]|uniref:uncharacterized protein n=1 Tax=Musca autumnalis TaxID=221902 RepID=UPI003CF6F2BC
MDHICRFCNAFKWKLESPGMCCLSGKVKLPAFGPLPEYIMSLLTGGHPDHKDFWKYIRQYNGCFQMTSFAAKQIKETGFMPTFKVQGQVYHLVGGLIPPSKEKAQFLQIYFVGEEDLETDLRCKNFPHTKPSTVKNLQTILHAENAYIKEFKTAIESVPENCHNFNVVIHAEKTPQNAHRRRYNAPTCKEIAIVIEGQQFQKRDIVIRSRDNECHHINELHRSYDPLQYPLMFCRGEDGYSINIPLIDPVSKQPSSKYISAAAFYAYRLMLRNDQQNHILYYRSLLNQYLVDMYAKIETERLNYIRNHQKELRAESYVNLRDALRREDTDLSDLGQLIILPSTFTGGPRYMHERTQDAMTYVRKRGRPDLFITFTCNPKWNEITDALLEYQQPRDRHDIIARVFHLKVKTLMALLTKGKIFGGVACFIYTVEWQKRGLPHIHILLWLEERIQSNMIDNVVCAELPDPEKDSALHNIVKNNMIHGPCGKANMNSPCMKNDKCTQKYPRKFVNETQSGDDGYPIYRRRSPDNGGVKTKIKDMTVDNRWVVPYNAVLLRTFNAHINVEICNSVKSIKYICKYINKGSDQAVFSLENEKDEIKLYQTGRYISSSEAVWRILAFPIHERYPSIFHLAVHLENGQRVYFTRNNIEERINNPTKTTLLAFFELCNVDDFAKTLLYPEVPSYYVWKANKFERRKRGNFVEGWENVRKDSTMGRVYTIHPNNSECFHLRMLLHFIRGPSSFSDLKNINGVLHPTFQSACLALGLLEDDNQWNKTLEEAAISHHPHKLRELFSIILVFCHVSNAKSLWEAHKDNLSEDILHNFGSGHSGNTLTLRDNSYNKCLQLIEEIVLSMGGQKLCQYGMPAPATSNNFEENFEFLNEGTYENNIPSRNIYLDEDSLSTEQKHVYSKIIESISSQKGNIFFLDAPGGTGKTYLLNLLLRKIRSSGSVAIAVASSGIAATLLEGGKTAHTTFKLPLNLTHVETPVCNISKQSNMAQILKDCKLIVWDESTMSHKNAFEAVDRTLKDIRNSTEYMGGITTLLAGDFRQTLPVIPRGTKADEISACIKASYLWANLKQLSLKTNMRAQIHGDSSAKKFSATLIRIGNGNIQSICDIIKIPKDLCNIVQSLKELNEKVYPDIKKLMEKTNEWLCERSILTPKNDRAAIINELLMSAYQGDQKEYLSIDKVIQTDDAVQYPVEFLNSLNPPGFPPHKLVLKVGSPVMLLRNLKPPKLCNGTRLRVKALNKYTIEAVILTGCAKNETVFIPRIPLIPSEYPFEFKRLQFPVKLSFAMTINKSQGQSLKVAGVDLTDACFSHGQFYVACSRVSSPKNLYILAQGGKTTNVVYKQVLR